MIVVNSGTRQFNIPGADLVFGVESDSGSERKDFQCPRYVGNNLDVASSFVRINYRNANGETDSYLVEDLTIDGDNVTFSWELAPKVTAYKGQVKFVMCVVGPDLKVKWHTTLGTGQIHEGLEPDQSHVEDETADVVAQLVAMVERQTAAVEAEGGKQIKAVQTAAEAAERAAVAQIEAKGASTLATIPEAYTAVQNAVRGAANAIRGKVSGEVIRVDDVSPMEHYPVVKVSGKNLIPYPYKNTTNSFAGVNFTDNGDGSVTMDGTSTGGCNFFFTDYNFKIKKGETYTLSLRGDFSATDNINFWIYSKTLENGVWTGATSVESNTFTADRDYTDAAIYLLVTKGASVSGTVYPMLEHGNTATAYTPYINPTTVTVTKCGKNLIPYPYTNSYRTLHGLTYTDGGNGIVKVEGTTTQGTNFFFAMHQKIKAGTYTLSGMANLSGMIALIYDDATKTTLASLSGGTDSVTLVVAKDATDCNIYLNQAYANKTVSGFVQLQLEPGNGATDYEPYVAETQIPAADGTVSGLSAVSPTMTLLTDTPGVNIECEYSRDTNKVINDILEKITAMGG